MNTNTKVVGSLLDDGQEGGEITLSTNDGNKEQEYCAGLGTCDFSTGEVRCAACKKNTSGAGLNSRFTKKTRLPQSDLAN